MATAHLGTLKEFNPAEESISSYLERVQLFFTANEVDARRQVPTFLCIVGPTTYATLRDLFVPTLPSEKSLDEIFQCLRHHFEPKKAIIDISRALFIFTSTTRPKARASQNSTQPFESLPRTADLQATWRRPS